jgi:hypothetical protein
MVWSAPWITSSYCHALRVASEKARDRNIFHCQKPWGSVKYHQSQETKLTLCWFTVSHDSMLIWKWKVTQHKIGRSCQEKSVNVKGNKVSKISGITVVVHALRLWWLNIQNKQTAINQQEITLSLKADIWRRKQLKPQLVNSTWKFSFVQIQSQ